MTEENLQRVAARRGADPDQLRRALRNLQRIKGEAAGQTHEPARGEPVRRVTVGSAPECDLRITDDPYVSNHHATLTEWGNGDVTVEDAGSINGTRVRPEWQPPGLIGGEQVHGPVRLMPGMTVRVGRTDIPWRRG